jgi:hypothetical protein
MRFTILAICLICVTGCAALDKIMIQDQNVTYAARNRKNLVGLTAEQLYDKYGEPNARRVSYSQAGTREELAYVYRNLNLPYETITIRITMINSVVTNVYYN